MLEGEARIESPDRQATLKTGAGAGAVTALFVGRNALPGVDFVAASTPEVRAKAEALLAAQRAKIGVMQRSRRDFDGELKRLAERARKASRGPPGQPTMMDSERSGT